MAISSSAIAQQSSLVVVQGPALNWTGRTNPLPSPCPARDT